MPILLAVIAAFFSSKKNMMFVLLGALSYLIFTHYQPYSVRDYQSDNHNRTSYILGESEAFIRKVVMPRVPDYSKALSYEEAMTDAGRLIYINIGGIRNHKGVDPYFFTANPHLFQPTDILVSLDPYLAETLATVSGHRWVRGGLEGYLYKIGEKRSKKLKNFDCDLESCHIVGVFAGTSFEIAEGFSYKKMALALSLENLLLPGLKDISIIKQLSRTGNVVIEVYGALPERFQQLDDGIYELLATHGVHNVSVIQPAYLGLKTEAQLIEEFKTSLSTIDSVSLNFLCKNDTKLLMSTDNQSYTDAIISHFYDDSCEFVFLPIEGMMPHEVKEYLKNNPLNPKYRYVGIYSDKLASFYTMMAADFLKESGEKILGLTPMEPSVEYKLMPIRQWIDKNYFELTEFMVKKIGRKGGEISFLAYMAMLMSLGALFVISSSRITYLTVLVFQNVIFLLAIFIASFHHQEAMGLLLISSLVAAIAQYLFLFKTPRKGAKLMGLNRLKEMGLRTPFSQLYKNMSLKKATSIIAQSGEPIIFRSNELTCENNSATLSGEFNSVVAYLPEHAQLVMDAWNDMKRHGVPAFIVQKHHAFSVSGAVSSATTHDGESVLVIESSSFSEGITDNRDPKLVRRVIHVEEAALEDDPLIKEAFLIWQGMDRHFVAEFGITDQGVTWLQLMMVGQNCLSLKNPAQKGYLPSTLNEEISQIDPWVLSNLQRYVPGIEYQVFGGKLFEKPSRSELAWKTVSSMMPWPLMAILAERVMRCSEKSLGTKRISILLRLAFMLSTLSVRKAASFHGTKARLPDHLAPVLSRIESPFGSRDMLSNLKAGKATNYKSVPKRRVLSSVLVRERSRAAIALLLAALYDKHPNSSPLGEPVIGHDKDVLVEGERPLNGFVFSEAEWERLNEQENAPEGFASIILTTPKISVFTRHDSVGEFCICSHVALNSHFVQRCRALGIGVTRQTL